MVEAHGGRGGLVNDDLSCGEADALDEQRSPPLGVADRTDPRVERNPGLVGGPGEELGTTGARDVGASLQYRRRAAAAARSERRIARRPSHGVVGALPAAAAVEQVVPPVPVPRHRRGFDDGVLPRLFGVQQLDRSALQRESVGA